MNSFTPGPWAVDFNNGGGGYTISAHSADHIVHTNEVAKVNNSKGRHVTSPEAKANGHLVSAAPDMLAALKRMVNQFESFMDTGIAATPEESKSIHEQMTAAIAKAEGSENGG